MAIWTGQNIRKNYSTKIDIPPLDLSLINETHREKPMYSDRNRREDKTEKLEKLG